MLSLRSPLILANRWLIPKNFSAVSSLLAHTDCSTPVATVNEESTTRPILSKNHRGYTKDGGYVYTGFTFYPRHPNHQEPPYEPSKALMVKRIRTMQRKPYWEKNVLIEIGLDGRNSNIVILPNTPNTCAKLWKVKHLVRITPIILPQGLPEDGDLTGARLLENGQLTFIPKLGAAGSSASQITIADLKSKPDHMDGETLRKHLRLKWLKPRE